MRIAMQKALRDSPSRKSINWLDEFIDTGLWSRILQGPPNFAREYS
jgi:hypothetical protein